MRAGRRATWSNCAVGDIAGGGVVRAHLHRDPRRPTDCGTFSNAAEAVIGAKERSSSTDTAVVEVPCPPQPDEPVILITKTASSTSGAGAGDGRLRGARREHRAIGDAMNVEFTDELPAPAHPGRSDRAGESAPSRATPSSACSAPVIPGWRVRSGRDLRGGGRLVLRHHRQQRVDCVGGRYAARSGHRRRRADRDHRLQRERAAPTPNPSSVV